MQMVKSTILFILTVVVLSSTAMAGEGQGGGGAAGFERIPLPTGLSKDTQFLIYYIDKRFEQVDKRFEQIEKRFAQMQHEMDRRFEQLHREMDQRFAQMDQRFAQVDKRFEMIIYLMGAIVAAFAAIVAVAIGFAIWDRRTMTRPFEEKIRKLEGDTDRLHRLIEALKKLAEHDPKLAEVLRSFSLL